MGGRRNIPPAEPEARLEEPALLTEEVLTVLRQGPTAREALADVIVEVLLVGDRHPGPLKTGDLRVQECEGKELQIEGQTALEAIVHEAGVPTGMTVVPEEATIVPLQEGVAQEGPILHP